MRIVSLIILLSLALVGCRTLNPAPETVTVTVPETSVQYTLLFAYQDGDGDWAELTSSNGAYQFEVTNGAGRYGVALVCFHTDDGYSPYLEPIVLHATTSEFSTLTLPCIDALYDYPDQVEGTILTGTVINVDPAAFPTVNLNAGGIGHGASALSNYEFNLGYLYEGVFDVVASIQNDNYKITRLAIEHDVKVENGLGDATVDWGDSRDVQTFDLTIRGVAAGDDVNVDNHLTTRNGTWASFTFTETKAAGSEHRTTYAAAPQEVLAPGDMHSLFVSATDAAGHTRSLMRNYSGAGEDLVVALPEGSLNLKATRVTTGAYPRFELTWDDVGATLINAYIAYDTDELETGWSVFITPGWLTERAYVLPDFSGLDSWDPAWNASEADLVYTFNWFGAFFVPTEQALHRSIYWEDIQEGEYRNLETRF